MASQIKNEIEEFEKCFEEKQLTTQFVYIDIKEDRIEIEYSKDIDITFVLDYLKHVFEQCVPPASTVIIKPAD